MGLAGPVEMVRRTNALGAMDRLNAAEAALTRAQQIRARAFAEWNAAGASYRTIATTTDLSRSTVVGIIRRGQELLDPNNSNGDRTWA